MNTICININLITERLLTELFEKNSESNNDRLNVSTSTESSNALSQSLHDSNNRDNIFNSRENIQQQQSIPVDKSESLSPFTIHPNRFQVLVNDSNTSFENEFEKAKVVSKYSANGITENKRPSNVVNQRPENDEIKYKQPKVVPGNASYSDVTRQDRKILLLSDSILGRIQLYKLNKELKGGRAIRKYFPGASPNDIANFCPHILKKEKFDVVVIHAGTNSLLNDDIIDIANELFNIVKVCFDNGVKEVLVSGVTFRYNLMSKITQLNNHIESKKQTYGFRFINNDNINANDIWRDKIHLSESGIVKIANNIIDAINALHTL